MDDDGPSSSTSFLSSQSHPGTRELLSGGHTSHHPPRKEAQAEELPIGSQSASLLFAIQNIPIMHSSHTDSLQYYHRMNLNDLTRQNAPIRVIAVDVDHLSVPQANPRSDPTFCSNCNLPDVVYEPKGSMSMICMICKKHHGVYNTHAVIVVADDQLAYDNQAATANNDEDAAAHIDIDHSGTGLVMMDVKGNTYFRVKMIILLIKNQEIGCFEIYKSSFGFGQIPLLTILFNAVVEI
jgi:hypothetical protein